MVYVVCVCVCVCANLSALSTAHAGPAAGIIAFNDYPIGVALFIGPKAYASLFVVLFEGLQNGHHLRLICGKYGKRRVL